MKANPPLRLRAYEPPRRRSAARQRWLGTLWLFATWLNSRRPARATERDVRRLFISGQARGRGLRMTAWLRDQLRPRWLRLRSGDGTE